MQVGRSPDNPSRERKRPAQAEAGEGPVACAPGSDAKAAAVVRELERRVEGEVLSDRLHRSLYATDASIYQIVPDAVVLPRSAEDVAAAVQACAKHGVPITARGAGTGLTGGAVNRGVILDCSRHLNRVLGIDVERRAARVQPGVVLDELNALLKPHGLQFAPDVATGNRATIGGMIANNSCGARSIIYGRTVDHVLGLETVLSDGSACNWGEGIADCGMRIGDCGGRTRDLEAVSRRRRAPDFSPSGAANGRSRDSFLAHDCSEVVKQVVKEYGDEIAARFPKVLRSNGGYGLDRLRIQDGRVNTEALLCGSEGTLCVIVGATLNLVPLPECKGLAVIQFGDLLEALEATPVCLEHKPAAVELIDRPILDAAKISPGMSKRRSFINGDPAAMLAVEVYEDREDRLAERLAGIVADLKGRRMGYAWAVLLDAPRQADVWAVRKAGLGLAQSKPGDRQPQAFIEDCAVDPSRLRDYIARLRAVLAEEGVYEAGYYAHASVGCLHIRPVLNLKRRDDVDRMVRIADRVSSLTLEFGGTMTGEHGDGIVRSSWLAKMYGPRIVAAFGKIKQAFDPGNILNPGKIVSPLAMTENLRYGGAPVAAAPRLPFTSQSDLKGGRREKGTGDDPCSTSPTGGRRYEKGAGGELRARLTETGSVDHSAVGVEGTFLDFSAYGGMLGLAEMCSGVGECRQRLAGTMCPSYRATGEEKDSTRGRANALRIAMTGGGLLKGLDDAAIAEVMDLCLSCKACKTECPTGVDMARLKAEWLARRQQVEGVPRRSKLIADLPELAVWGSRFAPLSNWLMRSRPVRTLMEWVYGLDRRVPPPAFARTTFRDWFIGRSQRHSANNGERSVVYFVDTWTNYYTPQVGVAAVKVLEALGYRVVVPPTKCCGRPAISKGLLWKAKRLAEANIAVLGPYAGQGVPIVGTEPSCLLTLVDEYPELVRSGPARSVAKAAMTIEAFIGAALEERPNVLRFKEAAAGVLYHGHCHQKALVGTSAAMAVLRAFTGGRATEIDSGCCGMAGSFGHEAEHYEIARAIGEEKLFPAVRGRGEAGVAVSGFSCRQHIEHHTDAAARHVVEYLADALPDES